MEFLFGKNKKKEKLVAIFDISSASIGAALARIPSDKTMTPTIVGSVRTEIAFHNELDFTVFQNDMLDALSKTAQNLYHLKVGAPSEVYCVLASPWYISETRILRMDRNISFVFTKKIADELIAKEVASLTASYKKKYPNDENEPQLIEQSVVKVSLNGYHVNDPINQRARSVEMNMVISLASRDCIKGISETLSKIYPHITINFSSFITSAYLAVRDKYINENSYLLIDISGEITDIAIITKDAMKVSLSFPFGRQTFFRFLRKKLNVEFKEAYSMFSLYLSKNLEEGQQQKMVGALDSISKTWSEAFRESIASLPHTFILPQTIFLISAMDIKPWFAEVVRCEEYIKSMVVEKKCRVVTLEGPEFLDMCKVKESNCDPFLMIEAISIMRKQK